MIHARRSSNKEYIEFHPNNHKLTRPQVFIICMNHNQIKNMIATQAATAQAQQGALAGLIQVMKGETRHPYPCASLGRPPGWRRPLGRPHRGPDRGAPRCARTEKAEARAPRFDFERSECRSSAEFVFVCGVCASCGVHAPLGRWGCAAGPLRCRCRGFFPTRCTGMGVTSACRVLSLRDDDVELECAMGMCDAMGRPAPPCI